MRYHIVLWKWQGRKEVERRYDAVHVTTLAREIRRRTGGMDVRIVCVTDDGAGIECADVYPLWDDCGNLVNATKANLPSCYRRLKLYDPQTQRDMGIARGDRIISLDLDVLVTGELRTVLETPGLYVGWLLYGDVHERVYNGSFQMFTAGDLEDVWHDFDPDSSPRAAALAGYRGSDQSWLSWKLVNRSGATHIDYPVFASYPLHCRRLSAFRSSHRIVFFHGSRKPWDRLAQDESAWITRYWRPEHALSQ